MFNGFSVYFSIFISKKLIMVSCFVCLGFNIMGKINILEFGLLVMMEFRVFGVIYNFWNLLKMFGGFSGGFVVVVVVGIVFIVLVGDGGGFICILVFCCGFFGFKLS